MYILAINSSYRGDRGFTQFLIDKVFSGARAEGAELATKGCISRGTQRKANKKVLPSLPPVRCLKERFPGISRKEMKETMASKG